MMVMFLVQLRCGKLLLAADKIKYDVTHEKMAIINSCYLQI